MDDDTRLLVSLPVLGREGGAEVFPRHRQPQGRAEAVRPVRASPDLGQDGTPVGFPDIFPAPVSRWKSPKREDILKVPALEIVADSEEAGPNMLVESEPLDDNSGLFPATGLCPEPSGIRDRSLSVEYHRDRANDPDYPLPRHYFPGDDPSRAAPNLWRHTAHIYTNWVKTVLRINSVLHRCHFRNPFEDCRGGSGPELRRVRGIVEAVFDRRLVAVQTLAP